MQYVIFPTPIDATVTLRHDQGWTSLGTPYTHPDGRKGQACTIPDGTPDQNGCRRIVSAKGKVTSDERGFLSFRPEGVRFESDDVVLQDAAASTLPRLSRQGQFLVQVIEP